MLKNVAFIFADIPHSAPMLWWSGRYICVSPEIAEGTARSFQKVWLNQYLIVTERRYDSLFSDDGILDKGLNFGKIHAVLHIKSHLERRNGIVWSGVQFDEGTPFMVETNSEGILSYIDNSDTPVALSDPQTQYLRTAFAFLLNK